MELQFNARPDVVSCKLPSNFICKAIPLYHFVFAHRIWDIGEQISINFSYRNM